MKRKSIHPEDQADIDLANAALEEIANQFGLDNKL
jgi:hypothetical protein